MYFDPVSCKQFVQKNNAVKISIFFLTSFSGHTMLAFERPAAMGARIMPLTEFPRDGKIAEFNPARGNLLFFKQLQKSMHEKKAGSGKPGDQFQVG